MSSPPKRSETRSFLCLLAPACTTVGVCRGRHMLEVCGSKYPESLRLARSRLIWNPPPISGCSTKWLYRMVATFGRSSHPSPVSLSVYIFDTPASRTFPPFLDPRTFCPLSLCVISSYTTYRLFLYSVQLSSNFGIRLSRCFHPLIVFFPSLNPFNIYNNPGHILTKMVSATSLPWKRHHNKMPTSRTT